MTELIGTFRYMLPFVTLFSAVGIFCLAIKSFFLQRDGEAYRVLEIFFEILRMISLIIILGVTVGSNAYLGFDPKGIENVNESMNLIPLKGHMDILLRVVHFDQDACISVLGKILLFIPFGFFCGMYEKDVFTKLKSGMYGFGIAVLIEAMQLFLAGHFDVNDIILCTFGSFLGAALFGIVHILFERTFTKINLRKDVDYVTIAINGAINMVIIAGGIGIYLMIIKNIAI